MRSKYNARRTTVDGYTFASKREAERYAELKLLLRSGDIRDLVLQPKFSIDLNGRHICTYIADYRYYDNNLGCEVIEDVKGVKTPVYLIKKKLVEALYGVTISEVGDLPFADVHRCGRCKHELQAVRPGKYQCPVCE